MKCAKCKFNYPEEILSPLYINGKYTKPVCGICAEELLGIPLHGEQAVLMRGEAEDCRKIREFPPNRRQRN